MNGSIVDMMYVHYSGRIIYDAGRCFEECYFELHQPTTVFIYIYRYIYLEIELPSTVLIISNYYTVENIFSPAESSSFWFSSQCDI